MKKHFYSLIILPLLFSCAGEELYKCQSQFVPGRYKASQDSQTFYIDITLISEEEYHIANGIDVVFDRCLYRQNPYIRIELFCSISEVKTSYHFQNLNFAGYRNDIWYIDSNNNFVEPSKYSSTNQHYLLVNYPEINLNKPVLVFESVE